MQQVCNVLVFHLSFLPPPVSSPFPLPAPLLSFLLHLSPLPSLSSPSPCCSIATSPTGSATSSGSKTHLGHSSHPTATATAKELRTPLPAEIKSSLLQHAEDSILFVYRQQEEEAAESQHGCRSSSLVIIKCYLAMAQVCLVQLMPSLAANCALAATRVVQTHFERGVGDTPTGWVGLHHGMHVCMYVSVRAVPPCRGIGPAMSLCCPLLPLSLPLPLPSLPSEVVGTQTWLACREALVESLAHLHSHAPHLSSPLSLASVCAEGLREASACGMTGAVALLHWYRAVHCLGRKKADVDSAVSSLEVSQSAIWSLGRLHSVSQEVLVCKLWSEGGNWLLCRGLLWLWVFVHV